MERRIAAVTGASSAIGAAIALALAEADHDLILIGRDAVRLDEVTLGCSRAGGQATTYPFDLADSDAMAKAVAMMRRVQGEPRVLVHCAGVFDWARIDEADTETWSGLMEVNVTAAMRLTRLLVPSLLSHPESAVILIGSGAGYQGFANNAAYVASKHAVLGFGRALFLDLRDRGEGQRGQSRLGRRRRIPDAGRQPARPLPATWGRRRCGTLRAVHIPFGLPVRDSS